MGYSHSSTPMSFRGCPGLMPVNHNSMPAVCFAAAARQVHLLTAALLLQHQQHSVPTTAPVQHSRALACSDSTGQGVDSAPALQWLSTLVAHDPACVLVHAFPHSLCLCLGGARG